jgi:hypothetical protein
MRAEALSCGLAIINNSQRGHSLLLEEFHMGPCVHRHVSTCSWSPLQFTQVPLPFADFMLCPFTEINHNCEYNWILCSMSLPSVSFDPGVK